MFQFIVDIRNSKLLNMTKFEFMVTWSGLAPSEEDMATTNMPFHSEPSMPSQSGSVVNQAARFQCLLNYASEKPMEAPGRFSGSPPIPAVLRAPHASSRPQFCNQQQTNQYVGRPRIVALPPAREYVLCSAMGALNNPMGDHPYRSASIVGGNMQKSQMSKKRTGMMAEALKVAASSVTSVWESLIKTLENLRHCTHTVIDGNETEVLYDGQQYVEDDRYSLDGVELTFYDSEKVVRITATAQEVSKSGAQ